MKTVLFCLSIWHASILLNAQSNTKGAYAVLKGNMMGAEAVIHLHAANKLADGFLYLVRDPRPFAIISNSLEGDSIKLYGSRSPQIVVILTGKLTQQGLKGTAQMEMDGKTIRTGALDMSFVQEGYQAFSYDARTLNGQLPTALKNQSQYYCSGASIWPAAGDPGFAGSLVKKETTRLFSQPTATSAGSMMEASLKKIISTWQSGIAKEYPKGAADMGMSLGGEWHAKYLVLYEGKYTLVLYESLYQMMGGAAHGNSSTKLYNIDKRKNKVLTLQDLLTPAGIAALPALLDKAARAQFGIAANQPLDQRLLVKKVPVPAEFYITDAGVGFWYNPYELASFADGELSLFIPLALLSKYIQPAFLNP